MKIFSLSFSNIQIDNRVIRQCESLCGAGYSMTAFGLWSGKNGEKQFPFEIVEIDAPTINSSLISQVEPFSLLKMHKKFADFLTDKNLKWILLPYSKVSKLYRLPGKFKSLCTYLICKFFKHEYWKKIFWKHPLYSQMLTSVESRIDDSVKVIIANDWQCLPIASLLSQKYGIPFVYDSHEHAISENNHLVSHKLLKNSFIFNLEKECISKADLVTSVSSGILQALKQQYDFRGPMLEVRSTPHYEEVTLKPTDPNRIILYYHGYLKENRNLELILDALPLLDKKYQLVFRGGHESSRQYEVQLKERSKLIGVSDRFSIEPMLRHNELFKMANMADIGLIILPNNSLHFDMALPNKFFEYVMAGLAVGVSSLTEMKSYIRKYEIGFVFEGKTSQELATQINAYSPQQIDSFKERSLKLARHLCWEEESKRFVNEVNQMIGRIA